MPGFDEVKQVDAGVLSVGYVETGPADGPAAPPLHGWPYDIHAFVDVEQRLAAAPTIAVPTITLEGDANGAPHPDPAQNAAKFTGPYSHRMIEGGIGHDLPQEAPEAFADAVLEVAGGLR